MGQCRTGCFVPWRHNSTRKVDLPVKPKAEPKLALRTAAFRELEIEQHHVSAAPLALAVWHLPLSSKGINLSPAHTLAHCQ